MSALGAAQTHVGLVTCLDSIRSPTTVSPCRRSTRVHFSYRVVLQRDTRDDAAAKCAESRPLPIDGHS
jgi:hypothetical protein